jgi:ABC-type sugar transport system ATPase subunit
MNDAAVIELSEISKKFPGVTALDKVSLSVSKGEIRALVGENGAGKSTVAKVIAGVYPQDGGQMILGSELYHPSDILDGHNKGVSILYQEPSLESYLSVGENIFLASLTSFAKYSLVSWRKLHGRASALLKQIGADEIDSRSLVSALTVGQKKLVELARALSYEPRLLLIDETTAALNKVEVDMLFKNLQRLKEAGTSILYISHRLEEVFRLCDTVTVLRDGQIVRTLDTSTTNIDELSCLMVGRELDNCNFYRDKREHKRHDLKTMLETDGLTSRGRFKDVSFQVRSGEIVGMAGLIGSGSEDVLEALFGIGKIHGGRVSIGGQEVRIDEPAAAIAKGIAYVPKERDEDGLIPRFSVKENICMAILNKLTQRLILDRNGMVEVANDYRKRLSIKTPSVETSCLALSGGNRQKVVLGKWLGTKPSVLLLNNPTRGIDIGAKTEVYKLINELAEEGLAVLMASDELMELLGMSDRLIVMKNGRVSHVFENVDGLTEEAVIQWMI